jgi:hypothetical protein
VARGPLTPLVVGKSYRDGLNVGALDVHDYAGLVVGVSAAIGGLGPAGDNCVLDVQSRYDVLNNIATPPPLITASRPAVTIDPLLLPGSQTALWVPTPTPTVALLTTFANDRANTDEGGGWVVYGCRDSYGYSVRMLSPPEAFLVGTTPNIAAGGAFTAQFWHVGPIKVAAVSTVATSTYNATLSYFDVTTTSYKTKCVQHGGGGTSYVDMYEYATGRMQVSISNVEGAARNVAVNVSPDWR